MPHNKQKWLPIMATAMLLLATSSIWWQQPAEAQDPAQATPAAEEGVSLVIPVSSRCWSCYSNGGCDE